MAVSRPEGKDMDDDDSETSSPVSGGFVPASAYQGELPKLVCPFLFSPARVTDP